MIRPNLVVTLRSWCHKFTWAVTVLALHVRALAQASQPSSTTTSSSSNERHSMMSCQNKDILNGPQLQQAIKAGRAYQHFDFLSETEVANVMWEEIRHLEQVGGFSRSGLSNTVQGSQQNFGSNDRTLCPAPWWADSLLGKEVSSSSPAPSTSSNKGSMELIASRIQDLRLSLASLLDRPTMKDESLAHECYYSMSTIGSFLPRHMDERHEELKGAKGWLLPSRRSLSWLIYLSDPEDWSLDDHGGALRTFPSQSVVSPERGGPLTQDDGNLQIGWLLARRSDSSNSNATTAPNQPVYLDSWFPIPTQPGEPPEPHCILYIRNSQREQVILTKPWLTEFLHGISVPDFLQSWALRQSSSNKNESDGGNEDNQEGLFLDHKYAQQFALIEDRPAWDQGAPPEGTVAEDFLPKRGSLVVFDSVTLPHQVELIKKGKRVALAGWFHEATQPFPEGLYS